MIGVVLDGISQALKRSFPECSVYGGQEVAQGLEKPCFFVTATSIALRSLQGSRVERRQRFAVQYYPRQEGDFDELYEVAEQLFLVLETIETEEGKLRGTELRTEMGNGALCFLVSYNMIVRAKETPSPPMGALEQNTGVS